MLPPIKRNRHPTSLEHSSRLCYAASGIGDTTIQESLFRLHSDLSITYKPHAPPGHRFAPRRCAMLNEWEALSPANLGFRGFVGFTSKTYLIVNKSQVGFGSQNRRLTTPIPSRKKSGINRCPSAS